ncbi:hepatitis A virus cellular receptor 2 homolog [Halichoeres trimaculatus]|uniref:hepatitis A virus cellular receptor 2 homolog n=1 Tax=Halichoeres trimaculatus TaxID=147232 RepID=UPI003D9EC4CB
MLPLLLLSLTAVLTVPVTQARVSTDTVVGVAGRRVMLPCRAEAVNQPGVEVCWGRGEPSLFTCHNTVLITAEGRTTYRKSYRYSSTSPSSLSIFSSRPSDAGFYHCRVQVPGLFNDQTSTIHLIIIKTHSVVSESTDAQDAGDLNTPYTTAAYFTMTAVTEQTGSGVTESSFTEPIVALVQSSVQEQQLETLQIFIGNTLRASFIIFVPALLLTAAHKVWRANQRAESDKRLDQSEEEDSLV